jgi:hypothetical protein
MYQTNSEVADSVEALIERSRQILEVSKRITHESVELCCDLTATLSRIQESRSILNDAMATAKRQSHRQYLVGGFHPQGLIPLLNTEPPHEPEDDNISGTHPIP